MLASDNKSFQLNVSYLLDLAQRAEELFKESDEALQNKLLEYVLSNIELKDKKLSYNLREPFRTIVETKKKALSGSNSNLWCGWRDSGFAFFVCSLMKASFRRSLHCAKPVLLCKTPGFRPAEHDHEKRPHLGVSFRGAGGGTQTRGLILGKDALYQLSYTRISSVNCK